ncbi:class I SAM-dependent methyltransferase [Campylobacter sp. CCS1377]|uniref:Class I SAM-dependent methyltransferase n=1 Tax=Campylobacter sp. CCS1377 TaxID=3158229 RepID=A0AAU7E6V5_9BACT|nr:class I SAM-dependent methyltransferase [Campylobacter jejuni]
MRANYYDFLCTKMYEILHAKAPKDELDFYLSYAKKEEKILELMCGSGRFLLPFVEQGFDISGVDNSASMLEKLKEKTPNAKITKCDILDFKSDESFDYIFISSGSLCLITDINECKRLLRNLKSFLKKDGKLVFALDTIMTRYKDDNDYKISVKVKTEQNFDLILKNKNHYDEFSKTQFSPSIYELYDKDKLLQSEKMDFKIHLYDLKEIKNILKELEFERFFIYSSFDKKIAKDDKSEMFLCECIK